VSVGDSASENATSLYGYLGLNPSVIPSVKSSEKNPRHHTVTTFQKNCIADGRYLLVYTDKFGDGIISVGKNYRRKSPSVIPFVFADFLVVEQSPLHLPLFPTISTIKSIIF
jgi:hypothetical protein